MQVTHTGGLRAWESGDGLTLYIEKESPRDLWEKPTVGGPEKLIFSSIPGDPVPMPSGFWFNTPGKIVFLEKAGVAMRAVYSSPTSIHAMRHQMSISPDGHYAVFTEYTENRSELILVEGFR